LTGGWLTGQPAAGDIDDDGLMELAWATREGNFFVWDTPAPICNTATTANLDGRDGAYNPLVNTRNNNVYGADTVPPARFAPADILVTTHDRSANTITLTVARIPGDDVYCGRAARFDFRFSTSGPITSLAAFAPAADALTLTLADADGTIYTATVPAGSFVANRSGSRLTFRDLTGTIAAGLTRVTLTRTRSGVRFFARGRNLDLSGADK